MVNPAGTPRAQNILISGAGTAGQSLAYWLRRHGFSPTVVERASGPRSGGFAIDLRGAAVEVAEHMGILDEVRRAEVDIRQIVHVNQHGEVVLKTDGNFGGGDALDDVEILREDLNNIIRSATGDGVEYIFNDSIADIVDEAGGAEVTFESGGQRRFDLIVGCDGQHSNVRSIAFGPENQFARPLGLYVAIATIPNLFDMDREWWSCHTPGKWTSVIQYGHDKHTRGVFFFTSPPLDYDRHDISQQKDIIRRAYADETNWKTPSVLDAMLSATDLYFDDVTQMHMHQWAKGRVALVGDAAYAPTPLSGQGTSLAVVGSYVLAGELKAAEGDHRIAFERYQNLIRSYVEQNQSIVLRGELSIPDT